ncbi:MAG TPA: MBOAT family O-acyltransferase [Desulfomonilaceae bacterium]|nr:MBOAT family O-acyltransferase [Desulfomonilaceae bacterium]
MDFVSPTFLVFVTVAVLLFHVSTHYVWRTSVLAVSNVLFIASYVNSVVQLLPLGLFLLTSYVLVRLLERNKSRAVFVVAVCLTVGSYVYLKQYTVIDFLPHLGFPYLVVGLSYIFFRILHVMIDVHHGSLPAGLSAVSLFNYSCSFLTFPTGPIARYEDVPHGEQLGALSVSHSSAAESLSRVINGYIKIVFLSALMNFYHARCLEWMSQFQSSAFLWVAYGLACVTYLLYLYLNFSGYMDVAIGFGLLFGLTLPENFNYPLSAGNFLELWSRWHITLSEWFKFYIFNPIAKALMRRWNSPALMPYVGVFAYLITFVLMGVWHGSTTVFLVYGLFLGVGVSANKLYEILMRKKMGKRFGKLREKKTYQVCARSFMLSYFGLALTCLWMDFAKLVYWAGEMGPVGILTAFLVGILVFTVVQAAWLAVKAPIGRLAESVNGWSESFLVYQLSLTARVFFVVCVLFVQQLNVPESVYRGF